jgi:pimeloyl-ACP methyl ester carboxylesterase
MNSDAVLIPGSWEHRIVHAHGARFHVAVQGTGPLVLFVHGFPTFWWLWRDFLGPVADLGFTAAAIDMRGYGATDHPPRGYDPRTLAADITGVVHALGFANAVVVGHGVGGLVAWTAATLQGETVRALAAVSSAHPNALRRGMLTDPAQIRALSYVVGLQRPFLAERSLMRDDAAAVGELLRTWVAPDELDAAVERTYRSAFLYGKTAHCSIEFHRWAMRSIPRLDGRAFAVDMDHEVSIPVLQVHGSRDSSILISTAEQSQAWAGGSYQWHEIDGGHLLPEHRGDELRVTLARWLLELDNG